MNNEKRKYKKKAVHWQIGSKEYNRWLLNKRIGACRAWNDLEKRKKIIAGHYKDRSNGG